MLRAIKHGLGNLWNFRGRDARQAFWYYVLFIYLINMALSFAVTAPMMVQGMVTGMQQAMANSNDPAAAQAATQAAMISSMTQFTPALLWVGMASTALMLFGLAASLVRRLHDSGLSGFWALIPGAAQVANLALAPSEMSRMQDVMVSQMSNPAGPMPVAQSMGIGALLGWGALAVVVLLGIRKSTEGPNRYGDAPFVA